ncbi:DsbA family oxidoreductase [Alkalihalobacillus pseudalcaliphilus]|uniref:DsbA family oxidoreductase n=1 Tax=Alkalihalobacillus pseudalcaliphilus TaxID=79884 RepID=UPI00064D8ACF|nr:DsbA family oxidoreductase [Alkalihalobacillus pseudalcaliphilus]KMK74617.1 hypothetical protein AB990_19150 [Alkalihalobacillus pseudalcaliphilus]
MKVEIWSDIACPFCYIGKRRFENALEQFEGKEDVEIIYKSFILDPTAPKDSKQSMNEMLVEKKGMALAQVEQMQKQVTAQANELDLDYKLDQAIMTNTTTAHRLLHFAKEHGKMGEMKEKLLQAYFIDGNHVGDVDTLATLASEIGLEEAKVKDVLNSDQYQLAVQKDIAEAAQIQVQGVPFYVFNRKYAVSGAQPPEAFLQVLNQVHEEEKKEQPLNVIKQGDACTDGSC